MQRVLGFAVGVFGFTIGFPTNLVSESGSYEEFSDYCREHFGAEKEPLAYQKFGKQLAFVKDGDWSHVSENSAVIAWETNLPANSFVEYGPSDQFGKSTPRNERPFYLHIHYLKGLEPGNTYHYRLVSIDERGNRLVSDTRRVVPKKKTGVIYIPGEMAGPPYRLDKPGSYVLTEDIDADVTAVDIVASNVVFDLNGHTITYDKSKDGYEKVKDTAAFKDGFGPKPIGGPHGIRGSYKSQKGGVRVLNGTVRQGDGGHGWWSAPITTPNWDEIAGVTMVYHGPQVHGIEGWVNDLHHNVIIDLGTEIPNRHQGISAIHNGANAHHNLIKRSRHRGINGVNGGKIYSNEIYIDSFATNSFGVFFYKTRGALCAGNRIFGTGYHFIGIGTVSAGVGDIKVHDNFIHGRTLEETSGRWSEYGDQSGANGLRVTWGGENIEWSDNVVVVEGRGNGKGEVRGVWHVPGSNQKNLVYHNNIFKAVADPEKETALGAVVISGSKDPENDFHGLFRNNLILSDFSNVSLGGLYYGDGTNGRFEHNTLVRIGDREDYRTIQAGVSRGEHASSGHSFMDNKFEAGAGYDKTLWRGDGEFKVGWTVKVKAAPSAKVIIHDKAGREVFSGNAGSDGTVEAALFQYRHSEKGKTELTPHTIQVEKDGAIVKRSIKVDRTLSMDF